MAKKNKDEIAQKDLGTVKEVYCSGVAITTTGEKIFIQNVSKGDRIVEENGKKKIMPKSETKGVDAKAAKQKVKNIPLNDKQSGGDFLDGPANSNTDEAPGSQEEK